MDEVKLAEILADHKGRIGSLEHRMDNVEKLTESVNNLTLTTNTLVETVKHTNEGLGELKDKVSKITDAPGERMTQIKTAIITALITGIISFAISAILMGV